MLKFWIHLRYGDAAFVNGWVGIAESPRGHDPDIVEKIKEELRSVVGKVEFTFVMSKDMVQGAEVTCIPKLRRVCETFEDRAKTARLARPEGIWYKPWAKQQQPTILLSVRDYWLVFENMPPAVQLKCRLRNKQPRLVRLLDLLELFNPIKSISTYTNFVTSQSVL